MSQEIMWSLVAAAFFMLWLIAHNLKVISQTLHGIYWILQGRDEDNNKSNIERIRKIADNYENREFQKFLKS